MTIIVEDGTIVANANSYVTVDEFKAYALNQGNTVANEADDDQIEPALIKATTYLQQKYRLWWNGSRVEAFQSIDWPRSGVAVPDFFDPYYSNRNVPLAFQDTVYIATNVIPVEVQQAQMMLALATIDGSGNSSVTLQPNYGRKTKREKAGSLEVEYMTAEEGGDTSMTATYWDAEQIIMPYLDAAQPHTGTVVRS